MNHALGVYYGLEHGRPEDKDYIRDLQPTVIRLLDPDVQQIVDMHKLAPNAYIATRIWSIDDNNGQAVKDLMADPVGTGIRHANQYFEKLQQWQREARERNIPFPPTNQIYFNAANEPNQGGTPDKIAAYNVAFLNRCTELNIRAAAVCLGVGWPDNTGPDTPVNWKPYIDAGLEIAIRRGNHWLELHEYFYKSGPQDGWRWWAGRHLQCPMNVTILLGEIGIDNYVDKARWDNEGGNRGWQGNVSSDTYANMIMAHIRGSDKRVISALIFITDFRNREWQSFDTSSAHKELLNLKDKMVPQAAFAGDSKPPSTIYLPNIDNGQPILFKGKINASLGLFVRSAPNLDAEIIQGLPFGTVVNIYGKNDLWYQIGKDQWVSSIYVTDERQVAPSIDEEKYGDLTTALLNNFARLYNIDPIVVRAVFDIESGGQAYFSINDKPYIRFENHVFARQLKDDGLFNTYFQYNHTPYHQHEDHKVRFTDNAEWTEFHGNQLKEWGVYNFARTLNADAADNSISVGMGQIMGFNHKKIGYNSAKEMIDAFSQPDPIGRIAQVFAFFSYCLNTENAIDYLRNKDWNNFALAYNGAASYAKLLKDRYNLLRG